MLIDNSVAYLVHFPDRHKDVHSLAIGRVAEWERNLDGWVVDEIKTFSETIDEQAVAYEVGYGRN